MSSTAAVDINITHAAKSDTKVNHWMCVSFVIGGT